MNDGEDDDDDDDGQGKLNSSGTSLDKYVGKGRNSKYMTLLPEDFEPGEMDVLCGRGKRCFNSPVSTSTVVCLLHWMGAPEGVVPWNEHPGIVPLTCSVFVPSFLYHYFTGQPTIPQVGVSSCRRLFCCHDTYRQNLYCVFHCIRSSQGLPQRRLCEEGLDYRSLV